MIAGGSGGLRGGEIPPVMHRLWRKLPRGTIAGAVVIGAVAATLIAPPRPRFIWNVSHSAPVGLYVVGGQNALAVGDMVAARVPRDWRMLAAMRRYVPANVPLIKRIAARPGDHVCAKARDILVNGEPVAARRARDGAGRAMPRWTGCTILGEGSYLLLMKDPASFDGRYFGPTDAHDIVGEVRLLWAR